MHLSIVIPAFNEELLILDCLNSIQESVNANQKPGFTHEVIVVDNNSTDKTAELAAHATLAQQLQRETGYCLWMPTACSIPVW